MGSLAYIANHNKLELRNLPLHILLAHETAKVHTVGIIKLAIKLFKFASHLKIEAKHANSTRLDILRCGNMWVTLHTTHAKTRATEKLKPIRQISKHTMEWVTLNASRTKTCTAQIGSTMLQTAGRHLTAPVTFLTTALLTVTHATKGMLPQSCASLFGCSPS